ncbi:MAG: hypothetical protein RLZZ292_1541 [Bacteroidota bacterium]|jgi:hypothetical protein
MDIIHQVPRIVIGRNRNATKRFFKQTACSLILFVDGLGVGIEKIRKLFADNVGCRFFLYLSIKNSIPSYMMWKICCSLFFMFLQR